MTNFLPFNYKTKTLRILEHDGELWFVAADICAILGLGQITNAIRRLDDDEVTLTLIKGSHRKTNIVSESGFYDLVLRSDKPEAKPFRKWVTKEVLPAIRKTGRFEAATTLSPAQCRSIQEAVNERAFKTGETHQFIYSGLKTAFRVAKYDQIKATDFDAAMQHIGYAPRPVVGSGYTNEELCNDIIELGERVRLAKENFAVAFMYMREAEKHLTPASKKMISMKTNAVYGRAEARKAIQ